MAAVPDYPGDATFRGRGVVMSGGGVQYGVPAWASLNMLRRRGCTLPVEIWCAGGPRGRGGHNRAFVIIRTVPLPHRDMVHDLIPAPDCDPLSRSCELGYGSLTAVA